MESIVWKRLEFETIYSKFYWSKGTTVIKGNKNSALDEEQ